jgi:exopolysaccharide production protein ExoZ
MITSIRYLRGIAAMLVVVQHLAFKGRQYSGDPLGFFHVGHVGVDIFFIISGFIMCHTCAGGRAAEAGPVDFLKRRAARIFPLYWLLTLAALLVYFWNPNLVNSESGDTRVVASFLLLPTDGHYLVANGWTLAYEFYFYLIFACGMFFRGNSGRWFSAALLALLVVLGPWVGSLGQYARFLTDPMLVEFIYGMGLYFVYRSRFRLPGWAAVLCVCLAVGLLIHMNSHELTGIRCLDLGVPAVLICAGLVSLESELQTRRVKALEMLGDSSYSLYLVHPFVLSIVSLLFKKSGLLEHGNAALFIASLAAGSVSGGWICFYFVETPLSKLVKGLMASPKRLHSASEPSRVAA